ncbi:MAG: hypothetical protein ACRDRA_22240 [Pseudonocardiaceae bacterium]
MATEGPGPARWASSPTDGKAHSLLPGDRWLAWCGHALPVGVVAHDQLPGWQWCVPCLVAHLVPEPVSPGTPTGRWLSDAPEAPGGRSGHCAPMTPAGHRSNPVPGVQPVSPPTGTDHADLAGTGSSRG